jgi:glycosyltransferase involved in cell wall biosynthesis
VKKTLFVLTSEFPFGVGETFLENEVPILETHFENLIFVTQNATGTSRINNEKIQCVELGKINFLNRIQVFFSKQFYLEIFGLIKKNKFSISTFRTSLYSLSRSFSIANKLVELNQKNLKNGYESIFYSYWLDEKAIAIALLKSKNKKLKAVSRCHGWDIYEERQKSNYLPYRNFMFKELDKIFPISENGKNYILKNYNISKSKIIASRLGTRKLENSSTKQKTSDFHILSISSLIPLKRVDLIIASLSLIDNINIHWTHIGSGPLESEILKLANEKFERKKNITYSFNGHLSNQNVRLFLESNQIDLFMNLSETEGIPVSIMEAQSAGIPVLATNVGGTSEIVNNENGILISKKNSPNDIAHVLTNYIKQIEKIKTIKRNKSYSNWENKYNSEMNFEAFISLINE